MTDSIMPITAEWLASIGFKYHQFDRQSDKHWLLWLGDAIADKSASYCDLGIELAPGGYPDGWFCWLRSDAAHRYHRFLHVRHLHSEADVTTLISALVGRTFDPVHCWYGGLRTPERAEAIRAEHDRLNRRLAASCAWSEREKDETRGGPLLEHMDAFDGRRS